MKYYLIAGERSGDMHGSNLVRELRIMDPEGSFVGFGGALMKGVGMRLLSDYKKSSFMGFWEVFINLGRIWKHLRNCKRSIVEENPDVIILIDYSGFNLKIAKYAKKKGFKVVYYIAPKLWAWGKKRVKTLKKYVDDTYVIFPFEVEFFQTLGLSVSYVGNPLFDSLEKHSYKEVSTPTGDYKIAFLPGSRIQEIRASIEMIKELATARSEYQILIAGVENIDASIYDPLKDYKNVSVFIDRTYDILKVVDVAVVTSGTATLETALLNVPQVVCYRTSWLSYTIAKSLVNLKYISLVNLIVNKEVVKELIQNDYTLENVLLEIDRLLNEDGYKQSMQREYEELIAAIGDKSASKVVAYLIHG